MFHYDIYLPSPLSDVVLAKMESFSDQGKGFSKTVVDLTKKACFPDIRRSFNDGTIGWKDILERNKATRFREWFATNGGDPEVALETYGEEFKASTGLKGYRDKIFSIIKYGTTVVGAAVGHVINGGTSVASPVLGAIVGGMVPFVKDLIKASEEENWKPRFFGNWVHEKVLRKED